MLSQHGNRCTVLVYVMDKRVGSSILVFIFLVEVDHVVLHSYEQSMEYWLGRCRFLSRHPSPPSESHTIFSEGGCM